jgi:hypothetical protein
MKTIIITVGDEAKYIIGEESSKKSFLGPCSFVFVVSCVACQLLRVSFCYTMVCALLYKYAISCCACAFVYIVSYGACAFVDVLYIYAVSCCAGAFVEVVSCCARAFVF